ncbi:hypothetical protein D9M68_831830 [compost metagenome]
MVLLTESPSPSVPVTGRLKVTGSRSVDWPKENSPSLKLVMVPSLPTVPLVDSIASISSALNACGSPN